jgi:hypothetical protein
MTGQDFMDEEPQLAPLTAPPSLEGLDSEGRIEAMVAWFFENFEDPAHETPYVVAPYFPDSSSLVDWVMYSRGAR